MAEETKAVETAETAAPQQQEVKKEESGASADQAPKVVVDLQTDYEKVLAQKDAELAALAKERDNYKHGLLVAKGKLPEEETPVIENQSDLEAMIATKVRDVLYSEKERTLQAEKDAILQQAIRENREMKVALANKQGMATTGSGTAADNSIATEQFFTAEQLSDLKKRGVDPNKVKETMLKLRK